MTSKVMKTEKSLLQKYFNFYQSHNCVFKLFKNHTFCAK